MFLLGSKLTNSVTLKCPNRLVHLLQNVLFVFRLKVLSRKQQEAATNKEEVYSNINEIKVLSNCSLSAGQAPVSI